MDSKWASVKTDWHDDALCKDADPDLFAPNMESEIGLAAVKNEFCNPCPVRGKCLNSAMINKDLGYWGGTDTATRRKLLRTRNRSKCPSCSSVNLIVLDQYEVCIGCAASWKAEKPAA